MQVYNFFQSHPIFDPIRNANPLQTAGLVIGLALVITGVAMAAFVQLHITFFMIGIGGCLLELTATSLVNKA